MLRYVSSAAPLSCPAVHSAVLALPSFMQVGDRVLLPEYGGHTVKLGEVEEYHLYRDEDILGKFQ